VRVEAEKAGEAKEKWIVARSPEELETWLSGAVYVAPALFFKGGGVGLCVVAVSEAVVDEVGSGWRWLEAPAESSTTPWPPPPDAAS
jgi:hypothetical protein